MAHNSIHPFSVSEENEMELTRRKTPIVPATSHSVNHGLSPEGGLPSRPSSSSRRPVTSSNRDGGRRWARQLAKERQEKTQKVLPIKQSVLLSFYYIVILVNDS